MTATLAETREITKRFPGLIANWKVDFDLRAGEVHALLGENGAGKTTLMNIVAGLYRPDEGEILIGGRQVQFHSPRDALQHGVGMVHQHFQLVESFTVLENLALSCSNGLLLKRNQARGPLEHLCQTKGLTVDPTARIWQLSVGEKQRVEILKLLGRDARILILDEPTAVLTPQESEELFATLRHLASQGKGVVFISHKLNEVLAVADRVTVLRAGQKVATLARAEASTRELARLMVGREISLERRERARQSGPAVVTLRDVHAASDRGHEALRGLDLEIRAVEILGLAGVAGNGQRELAEVMAGMRPTTSGRIVVGGRELTNRGARATIRAGVGYVPEDRLHTGLVPGLDVLENLILKQYAQPPIGHGIWLNRQTARSWSHQLVSKFAIRHRGLGAPVRLLSGGNQQKLVLARELANNTRVLVAVHPTRGLDIGATEQVHQLLLEQRQHGTAILLVSEDLDEILALSDRVAVIYGGRIVSVLDAEATDRETIGLLMGGSLALEPTAA